MSGLRVFDPPIGPGHTEWIDFAVAGGRCHAETTDNRDSSGRVWCCTAAWDHLSDHAAHDVVGRLRARWPRDPSEKKTGNPYASRQGGGMRVVRVYDPPIGPEHPHWLDHGLHALAPTCGARTRGSVSWYCTRARFHQTDHAAHGFGHRLQHARWPRDPSELQDAEATAPAEEITDTLREARAAADEADDMIRACLADLTRDSAVLAIDRAAITRDDYWFECAEHLARALHALALVGSGVAVEDDGGEVT